MPARTAAGRLGHAAITAAKSGSVGLAGGVGGPKPPPLLPDLLPPESETRVFPAESRRCSSPSGGTFEFHPCFAGLSASRKTRLAASVFGPLATPLLPAQRKRPPATGGRVPYEQRVQAGVRGDSCREAGPSYGPVTFVTAASNCCFHSSALGVFRSAEFNAGMTAWPGCAGMSAVAANGFGSIVRPIAVIADAGSSATHAFDFDLVRKSAASCGVWNTRR